MDPRMPSEADPHPYFDENGPSNVSTEVLKSPRISKLNASKVSHASNVDESSSAPGSKIASR